MADRLGVQALAVWQTVARLPNLGAHARVSLTAIADDEPPPVTPADGPWLAVEFATAALDGTGPDEALTVLFDRLPGEGIEARMVKEPCLDLRVEPHFPHHRSTSQAYIGRKSTA